jgi:predicted HTH domain antitoxin
VLNVLPFLLLVAHQRDSSVEMTAEKVIEEIQSLPREEQSRVVQFAVELARSRQLSGAKIAALAEKMVNTTDPAAKARLRAELTRGFYGD